MKLIGLWTAILLVSIIYWVSPMKVEKTAKFSDKAGVIMIPVDPIYMPTSYWTHIVRQEVPCINKLIGGRLLQSISYIENQAQAILLGLYELLVKSESDGKDISTVLAPVGALFSSQALINRLILEFWVNLKLLTVEYQYSGRVFSPNACNMSNYLNRVREGMSASHSRADYNYNMSTIISERVTQRRKQLSKSVVTILDAKLKRWKVHANFKSDTEAESHSLPLWEASTNDQEDPYQSTIVLESPFPVSPPRVKRSHSQQFLSNQYQNLSKSGCILQQFSSPVHNAIAFAWVDGQQENTPLSNNMEPLPPPSKADVEFIRDSLRSDNHRRYDFMDICYLGANSPIDDLRVYYSVLKHAAHSLDEAPKLAHLRALPRIEEQSENSHSHILELIDTYSTSVRIMSSIMEGSLLSTQKIPRLSATLCAHDIYGKIQSGSSCWQKELLSDKALEAVWKIEGTSNYQQEPQGPRDLQPPAWPRSRYSQRSRSKRALFPFMADYIYSPLFGLASQTELNSIKDYLKDFKNVTDSIRKRLTEQDSFDSVLVDGMRAFKDQLKILGDTLQNHLKSQKEALKLITDASVHLDLVTKVSLLMNHIQSHQMSLIILTGSLSSTASAAKLVYSQVRDTIFEKKVSISSKMGARLEKLAEELKKQLPPGQKIPSEWIERSELTLEDTAVGSFNRDIINIFRIPVVTSSPTYQVWRLSSLPFQLNGSPSLEVIQLLIPADIIVSDSGNKRSLTMSLSDYNMCRMNPGHICRSLTPWHDLTNNSTCIHKLNQEELNSTDLLLYCEVKSMMRPQKSMAYAVSVSQTRWLISVINGPITSKYSCGGTNEFRQEMSGMTIVSLKDCDLYLDDQVFLHVTKNVSDEIKIVLPEEFSPSLNHDALSPIIYTLPPVNVSYDLPSVAIERLSKLPKLQGLGEGYHEAINTALTKLQNALPNRTAIPVLKEYYDFSPPSDKWSWFSWFGGSMTLIFGVVIAVYLALKCRRLLFPTSAIVTTSMLPLVKSHTLVHISPTSLNLTESVNKTITDWLLEAHKNSMPHYPSVTLVIMIVMLLIMGHHCYMLIRITRVQRELNLRSFVFPYDSNEVQHLGEDPLVLTLILEFTNLIGRTVQEQIGIQITTLPAPAEQYYVDDVSKTGLTADQSGGWLYPFTSMKFVFNWHLCCIKSNIIRQLDTCQSLPASISICKKNILDQTSISVPCLWIKWRVVRVCRVIVCSPHDNKHLYTYTTQLNS